MDRWHINSPVSLPILSRTIFLISQTYLTQNVFILHFLSLLKFVYAVSWLSWCPGAESEGGGGVGSMYSVHKLQRREPSLTWDHNPCVRPTFYSCVISSILYSKRRLGCIILKYLE